MQPELSIVIPAYNEARRIGKTLKEITKFLNTKNLDYEIIVVNDGSQDETKSIVEGLKIASLRIVEYGRNRGKGYAVNYGMNKANGKYILFADADNSTPFYEILELLKYIDQYPVVIGSRYIKGSKIKLRQPISRIIGSRIGNLLVQLLLLPGVSDTQCGFKLFQSEAAKKIFAKQTIWRWGFDMEILRIAKEQKLMIKQVPVDWFNDEASTIPSSKVFVSTLKELFKIKKNSLAGLYKG